MNVLKRMGGWIGRRLQRQPGYLLLPIVLPVLMASVTRPSAITASVTGGAVTPPLRYDLLDAQPTQLGEHSVVVMMEQNQTLESVFRDAHLDPRTADTLARAFGQSIDLRRLRPGNLVRFHLDRSNQVDSVEMKMTGWGELDALRNGDHFDVSSHPAGIRDEVIVVSGTIDSSLYDALRSSGEGPQLVQQLVDVFQWDIDFFALQKGDAFQLVVPKRYAGGEMVSYGAIRAARFIHQGVTYEAFRHESANGSAGYYTAGGNPLRKQFLRAPLQFTRITSSFSNRRFHPILHVFRAHHGVDYGAPAGTPVMTTADGTVLEAGYRGGEGNCVCVRHSSSVETCYLHLSRFAKGIHRGSRVTQGDTIGYVGMTGLATGPHLDYRVREDGEWINPLSLRSITADPLRGADLNQFHSNVRALQVLLAAAPDPVRKAAIRSALF